MLGEDEEVLDEEVGGVVGEVHGFGQYVEADELLAAVDREGEQGGVGFGYGGGDVGGYLLDV